ALEPLALSCASHRAHLSARGWNRPLLLSSQALLGPDAMDILSNVDCRLKLYLGAADFSFTLSDGSGEARNSSQPIGRIGQSPEEGSTSVFSASACADPSSAIIAGSNPEIS